MLVKNIEQVTGDDVETAWRLYEEAFRGLNELAVQRHLMYRSEFEDVMADARVLKYFCYDDAGVLYGLSTCTNQLESMPLLSPEYFKRRWPTLFEQRKIYYCGFLAVERCARGTVAFSELIEAMYLTASSGDGMIGMDVCRHNGDRRMAKVIETMLHRLSGGTRAECMDQQSYWMYEFGEAA